MHSFKSEGIILSAKDYSEADRIITIFTKNHGKLSMIAKGIRRPKSKKRGSLGVFNQIKFSASQTHGMAILTEVEIVSTPTKSYKNNLKKLSLAYYLSEVINRTTREDEQNTTLYIYLLNTLNNLKNEKKLKKLRLEFITNVLIILGFWPKGRKLINPDKILEEVTEKSFYTKRVGQRVLQ